VSVRPETTLYGTASIGGSAGYGSVFAVNIDGSGFTNCIVHSNRCSLLYNSDGVLRLPGRFYRANTLYGTALYGGASDKGTVFTVHTDGTGFTNLHSFNGSDGASPYKALIFIGQHPVWDDV